MLFQPNSHFTSTATYRQQKCNFFIGFNFLWLSGFLSNRIGPDFFGASVSVELSAASKSFGLMRTIRAERWDEMRCLFEISFFSLTFCQSVFASLLPKLPTPCEASATIWLLFGKQPLLVLLLQHWLKKDLNEAFLERECHWEGNQYNFFNDHPQKDAFHT